MRAMILIAFLAVGTLGGCLAPGATTGTDAPAETTLSPTDGTPTAAGSPSPTATLTTQTPSGTTPPPTVTPAEPTRAISYADLNPDQQAAFDAALDGGVTFVPNSTYVDGEHHAEDASVFRRHQYVEKNGTAYRLSMSTGELYASYGIEAAKATDVQDADVVAVENLSADVRDEVRWAVENGSHHVPMGKWYSLPEELQDTEYVRHEGDVYRLSYVVGDYWAETLTVERDPSPTVDASPTPTPRTHSSATPTESSD